MKLSKRQVVLFGIVLLVIGIGIFLGLPKNKYSSFPVVQSTVTPTPTPLPVMLTVLHGLVTIQKDGLPPTTASTAAQIMNPGNIVETKADGLATIDYQQGTLVRLGPNTTVTIKENNQAESIQQAIGSLYVRFLKIAGVRESFQVETPTALATVRGTKFVSFVDKKKTTKIVTKKDSVALTKKDEVTGNPIAETEKRVDENNQGIVSLTPVGTTFDSTKAVATGAAKLTIDENTWIEFNQKADELSDDQISSASSQFFITPTPIATPPPTGGPTKPTLPSLNSMPGEGYSRSLVKTDGGQFTISCIGANKNSTRVITDSANENDCKNDCPIKPLAEYAQNNGGFAAMNGMYFCPADYPACADKKNSFDTLFFNSRVKKYLNSDNNVYSTLPFLAVEANGNPLFKSRTLEWGRDSGIMAGTAGNPLLVQNGNQVATENGLDEKQKIAKAPRGAFAQKGDLIYLCTVSGATVLDSAKVYATLGADNAMNIDGGGSTAMWYNGSYIFGPGRSIPTAIIFARR